MKKKFQIFSNYSEKYIKDFWISLVLNWIIPSSLERNIWNPKASLLYMFSWILLKKFLPLFISCNVIKKIPIKRGKLGWIPLLCKRNHTKFHFYIVLSYILRWTRFLVSFTKWITVIWAFIGLFINHLNPFSKSMPFSIRYNFLIL